MLIQTCALWSCLLGVFFCLVKDSSSLLFIKALSVTNFSKTIELLLVFFFFPSTFFPLFFRSALPLLSLHIPVLMHIALGWVKMPRPSHQQHPRPPPSHSWDWERKGQTQRGGDPHCGHYYLSLWRNFNPEPLIKTDFMLHIKINTFCLAFMGSIRTTAAFVWQGLCCTKQLILEMKLQGFNHLVESTPEYWRYF